MQPDPKFNQFTVSLGSVCYRGPNPASTQDALAISGYKWRKIVARLKAGDEICDDGGVATCGCCMLYFENICTGCPIAQKTGERNCNLTPYNAWSSDPDLESAEAMYQFLGDLWQELYGGDDDPAPTQS